LSHLLDEPEVSASHVVKVRWVGRDCGGLHSASRLTFNHDLNWRVEAIEQPPERVEQSRTIRFRGALETERMGGDLRDISYALPQG
jgi:hypothetical protein